MIFYINKTEWQILEVAEDEIMKALQKEEENKIISAYGLCNYKSHEIWLDKAMCREQKYQTLVHELTHCYFWTYGVRFDEYPEEVVCDMEYGLLNFVGEILDKWKKYSREELLGDV